jgi:LuxR family quorum-sensing transcriptional regulator LasR
MLKLQGAVQDLGFDRMLFAVIPQPQISVTDMYLQTTYPPAWRAHYDQNDLRGADPTVEYCYKGNAPFVWIPSAFKGTAQQSLYEEAAGFGLRSGVTLPIRGANGELGMFTCVSDQAPGANFLKELSHNLGSLSLLRDVAYDSMSKYIRPAVTEEQPSLTARELECLQWMAAGKTAWEIGRILSISEAGVNFHFSNLRTKFGVSRRNDVVIKAIRLGMIKLPD